MMERVAQANGLGQHRLTFTDQQVKHDRVILSSDAWEG
jgi:hypothetical protein